MNRNKLKPGNKATICGKKGQYIILMDIDFGEPTQSLFLEARAEDQHPSKGRREGLTKLIMDQSRQKQSVYREQRIRGCEGNTMGIIPGS
jgi:hypothetical protein